jgi:hypothetical protein
MGRNVEGSGAEAGWEMRKTGYGYRRMIYSSFPELRMHSQRGLLWRHPSSSAWEGAAKRRRSGLRNKMVMNMDTDKYSPSPTLHYRYAAGKYYGGVTHA